MSGESSYYAGSVRLGEKTVRSRFLIPSGIRCIRGPTIERCFHTAPQVGIITTKSISLHPRVGYREPIYARYSTGSYINAVGLANPGAEQFLEELQKIHIPADCFLLVSIFGGDAEDFANVARVLQPVADGFELNLSCPHAKGYGTEIAQDLDLSAAIVAAVTQAVSVPVIAKLSAVHPQLTKIAQRLVDAGASGLCLTNTIGPSSIYTGGRPLLSNVVGGLSGNAIRPLALNATRAAREVLGPEKIIIGMGGIGTADHVRQFRAAGADIFGIGSALTGFTDEKLANYFRALVDGLASDDAESAACIPDSPVTMDYEQAVVVRREMLSDILFKLYLDKLPANPQPGELAGKYYFLCIPGVGEKPFAVYSTSDRSIVVRAIGPFTDHLKAMSPGDSMLIRGPYGRIFDPKPMRPHYALVGGGTGIASLYEIAVQLARTGARITTFLGGRSEADIFGESDFSPFGPVTITTNDGSLGVRGHVTAALKPFLAELGDAELATLAVVSCGPEPMVYAVGELAANYLPAESIYGAIEYPTSCGVGICGKCASPSGQLTCLEGPFLPQAAFARSSSAKALTKLETVRS